MTTSKKHDLDQQLKRDIIQGLLPVKQALTQSQLAQRYRVSRIPIRDTLQRLKAQGWLTEHGKSSVMVRPLDPIDAKDLYLMRLHVEPMLLAHAIPNINFEILGRAKDILQKLDTTPPLDALAQGEMNWHFHRCLYLPAQRPALMQMATHLHQLCARYIGFQEMELRYAPHSQDEHQRLLSAISQGDNIQAAAILSQHIESAGKALVKHLQQAK